MKRILIVEDDNDMLELLRIVFRDSGFDVTFSNIAPDNAYIQSLQPDLIFLDVRLKGSLRSGEDICRELKSDRKTQKIPVILISGEYNLTQIAAQCNADTYLAKPYNMLTLLSTVNRYLS